MVVGCLHRIPKNPKKGEYYLTDTVELAAKDGLPVHATVMDDLEETIGVNTRVHLSEVEAAMRRRINETHMLNGVTMIDPASVYIEADVRIGKDTTLMPNTCLHGGTELGEEISSARIRSSAIRRSATVVRFSLRCWKALCSKTMWIWDHSRA
jgi:bifunctional UDP-N-acetylglucosamine pyrophosphorylase/glucosamine-1-phosphate N-acetyltransferase